MRISPRTGAIIAIVLPVVGVVALALRRPLPPGAGDAGCLFIAFVLLIFLAIWLFACLEGCKRKGLSDAERRVCERDCYVLYVVLEITALVITIIVCTYFP